MSNVGSSTQKPLFVEAPPSYTYMDGLVQFLQGSGMQWRQVGDHRVAVFHIELGQDDAAQIMESCRFDRQRNIRSSQVTTLVREMNNGRFLPFTMITFVKGSDGSWTCIDGQHRLHSIRIAKKPQTFIIQFIDSPVEIGRIYSILDTNALRSKFDGIKALGAVPKLPVLSPPSALSAVNLIVTGFTQEQKLTAVELAGLLELWNPYLTAYGESIRGTSEGTSRLRNSPHVALGAIMHKYVPEKATEFWSAVATGIGFTEYDPRRRLMLEIMNPAAQLNASGKANYPYITSYVCYLWEKFLSESPVQSVRMTKNARVVVAGTPYDSKKIANGIGKHGLIP